MQGKSVDQKAILSKLQHEFQEIGAIEEALGTVSKNLFAREQDTEMRGFGVIAEMLQKRLAQTMDRLENYQREIINSMKHGGENHE
jgi:hypothetical protein